MKRPRKPKELEGKPGKYDKRNTLNDLTGKEWLLLTKSFWTSEALPEDRTAYTHPAPFLVGDVSRLISMFTKSGMRVLDPFAGSGSALVAALRLGREAVGVELYDHFAELACSRISELGGSPDYELRIGDSAEELDHIEPVDYIVTSPPYHNILKNEGKGIRHNQGKSYRIGPRDGVESYGSHENDLGNFEEYEEFLGAFSKIMEKCFSILKNGKYCTVIISDFTVNKKEICVQRDVVGIMERIGFDFQGTTILLQPVKPLFPFGYPYAYKINHHHQNIITFRKTS